MPEGKQILVIDLKEKGLETRVLDRGIGPPQNPCWSHSGRFMAFTEMGDVLLADRQTNNWKGFRYGSDPTNLSSVNYYDDACRVAPLATWLLGEIGASAHTPLWVDGFSWTPDDKRLYFHYQRQGGSGVSDVGYIDLVPDQTSGYRKPWFAGYRFQVRWIDVKGHVLLFDPAVCPDGSAVAVTMMNNEDSSYSLSLIDDKGDVLATLGPDLWQAAWRPVH